MKPSPTEDHTPSTGGPGEPADRETATSDDQVTADVSGAENLTEATKSSERDTAAGSGSASPAVSRAGDPVTASRAARLAHARELHPAAAASGESAAAATESMTTLRNQPTDLHAVEQAGDNDKPSGQAKPPAGGTLTQPTAVISEKTASAQSEASNEDPAVSTAELSTEPATSATTDKTSAATADNASDTMAKKTSEAATKSAPAAATATSAATGEQPEPVPAADRFDTTRSRARLRHALRPHVNRAQLMGALLCLILGFALVTQLQQSPTAALSAMPQNDLLRLLADVNQRSDRLDKEVQDLSAQRDRIQSGSDKNTAAADAAQQRLTTLGILAGTLPAQGPGIKLEIADPEGRLVATDLLTMIQELRDAGAETIQINSTRVVANTYFGDNPLSINGKELTKPYTVLAIGDAAALGKAMQIPGGVIETLYSRNAKGTITTSNSISITATVPAPASE